MDQGIIQNLNVHYRKRVLLRYIADIDQSKASHISVLDAIHMLSQAWNCVTPQTITNSFRHACFSTDNVAATSNDDEDFDVEDDIPLSRLREHGLTPDVLTELTRLDDAIQTCAELTDDDIVVEIKFNRDTPTPSTDQENDDPDDRPAPIHSIDDVLRACDIVRSYFETLPDSSDIVRDFDKISDVEIRDSFNKKTAKQSRITSSFK